MEFARIAAKRSKDPATQVGAIIVSKNKRKNKPWIQRSTTRF